MSVHYIQRQKTMPSYKTRRNPKFAPRKPHITSRGAPAFIREVAFRTPQKSLLEVNPAINVSQQTEGFTQNLIIDDSGQRILAGNNHRTSLMFQNQSGFFIFINYGVPAGLDVGYALGPQGFWEPNQIVVNEVYAWSIGQAKLFVSEGVG